MPFGNEPVRLLELPDLSNDTNCVTNAFRQRACSALPSHNSLMLCRQHTFQVRSGSFVRHDTCLVDLIVLSFFVIILWYLLSYTFRSGTPRFCGSKARDLSSISCQLNEVADAFFRTDHIAGGSGFLGASGVHLVGHKPVLGLINLATERQPEMLKFLLLQPALEDAVLHADSIVLANPGNPVEALGIGMFIRRGRGSEAAKP